MIERLLDYLSDSEIDSESVANLKSLALNLAFRGKIVSQNSDSESSEVMMEQILHHKKSLIDEGVLKKKSLIESDVIPLDFNIPSNWRWTTLEDIGRIFTGNSMSSSLKENKYSKISVGNPYIMTKNVGYGTKLDSYETGYQIPVEDDKYRTARPDTPLICKEGGSAGRKIGFTERTICFGNKLIALETFSNYSPKYVFYYYQSSIFFDQFSSKMTGLIGGISLTEFYSIVIPSPPIQEQYRIVNLLDELFNLIDKLNESLNSKEESLLRLRESALSELVEAGAAEVAFTRIAENADQLFSKPEDVDTLRQTILQLAVRGRLVPQDDKDESAEYFLRKIDDEKERLFMEKELPKQKIESPIDVDEVPYDLPRGWKWCRFASCQINRDSERIPLSKSERLNRNGPYDYYGASGVIDKIDDFIFEGEYLLIGEDGANLISRSRPIAFIASGKFWVNNHAHVLDSIDPVSLHYLSIYINSIDLTPYVSGVAQPKLNQKNMNNILIALPPLAEKHRIVKKVDELMTMCDTLEAGLISQQTMHPNLMDSLIIEALEAM